MAQQRMLLVIVVCAALTAITTVVAAIAITRRIGQQKQRAHDAQIVQMTATLSAVQEMMEDDLTKMHTGILAQRDWLLTYLADKPQLLHNDSMFLAEMNMTLFDQWAPVVGSSPDALAGFSIQRQYTHPDGNVTDGYLTHYLDVLRNGSFTQVQETYNTTTYVGHLIRRVGGLPVFDPAILFSDVGSASRWRNKSFYVKPVYSWAAADGSAYNYMTERAEFTANGGLVAVQVFQNIPQWSDHIAAKTASDVQCVIFDSYNTLIAQSVRGLSENLDACQAELMGNGTAWQCLAEPASTHPFPYVREVYNIVFPPAQGDPTVDLVPSMLYTRVGGQSVFLAARTAVNVDALTLHVVCTAPDARSASTDTVETVLSMFPAGGSALILIVIGVMHLWSGRSKEVWNAPKSADKPFVMMFTDVQSSTSLWACDAEAMSAAIEIHHDTIRRMLQRHGGYEVKTIGDAFMVAFKDPQAAVACAKDIQVALYRADWPDGINEGYEMLLKAPQNPVLWNGLRVRIGMHYGTGSIAYDEVAKSYDYYGTLVNTAARVEAVGHGGQILMTRELFEAVEPLDGVCKPMGPQSLRGLSVPVDLVQLLPHEFDTRTFPPLRLDKESAVDAAELDKRSSSCGTDGQDTYAVVDFDELYARAADKVATVLTDVPITEIIAGIRSSHTFMQALFSVGTPEFRKSKLLSIAEKWSVPVSKSNFCFDQVLVTVSSKVYMACPRNIMSGKQGDVRRSFGRYPDVGRSSIAATPHTTMLPHAMDSQSSDAHTTVLAVD